MGRQKIGKSGYEIKTIEENEEASLYFFLTIIIPLLIDDIKLLQKISNYKNG